VQDEKAIKTVAIIGGTGHQGPGLALRWAKSGQYRVIIGSRQTTKAEIVAAGLNATLKQDLVTGMANQEAAAIADIVVLTVPYDAHASSLESIRARLQGKVLVDVTVPLKPPKVSRVHILVCGDDKEAKAEAIALAEAALLRGIDAGPLQNAVVVEGLTAILIGINQRYDVNGAGLKITRLD